jgi:hypothetical protein
MSPHEIKKHHRDTFGEYIALSGDDTQNCLGMLRRHLRTKYNKIANTHRISTSFSAAASEHYVSVCSDCNLTALTSTMEIHVLQ